MNSVWQRQNSYQECNSKISECSRNQFVFIALNIESALSSFCGTFCGAKVTSAKFKSKEANLKF